MDKGKIEKEILCSDKDVLSDLEIECEMCSVFFVWTIESQVKQRNFLKEGKILNRFGQPRKGIIAPLRCWDCRQKRKAQFEAKEAQNSKGNFNL